MQPLQGTIEAMPELYDRYEVLIVSAAMEFPNGLKEKYDWLQKHFFFISWKRMVLCGSKTVVYGSLLIDNHFKNLDPFASRTPLFDQPHNRVPDTGRHQRVHDWQEIAGLFLQIDLKASGDLLVV